MKVKIPAIFSYCNLFWSFWWVGTRDKYNFKFLYQQSLHIVNTMTFLLIYIKIVVPFSHEKCLSISSTTDLMSWLFCSLRSLLKLLWVIIPLFQQSSLSKLSSLMSIISWARQIDVSSQFFMFSRSQLYVSVTRLVC